MTYNFSGSRETADGYPVRRKSGSRLIFALILAVISLVTYFSSSQVNVITGESQHVAISPKEEIMLGLRAAPEMASQHGGLSSDTAGARRVASTGQKLIDVLGAELARDGKSIPYPFKFHLLADPRTVNAFALPGGQVFLTNALYSRLQNEGQLAAVLGHEVGHVLSRHSAQQIAKQQLSIGLSQAAQMAGGEHDTGQLAMIIGQLVNMRYGREHELESDKWGVRLLRLAGYDPREMIALMKILEGAGGSGPPEFFSTHPKPANRAAYIEQVIKETEG